MMSEEDMTPEEFDAEWKAGDPVDLDVRGTVCLAENSLPWCGMCGCYRCNPRRPDATAQP